jgi:RsiW-degrading membrane proteinase PrsW (M82 family)
MNIWLIVALALAPSAFIAAYVIYRDRKAPEPSGMLLRAFAGGLLTPLLSIPLSLFFQQLGLNDEGDSVRTLGYAFITVATSEELAKFAVLWIISRSPWFDEPFDGIVYGVIVALGFATLENFLYVFSEEGGSVSIALKRMFTAVPAHAAFGAMMGYFLGLARHLHARNPLVTMLGILLAIFFHGSYDFFLMAASENWWILNLTGALASLIMVIRLARHAIALHHEK